MIVTVSLPVRSVNIIASDVEFAFVTVIDGEPHTYKTSKKTVGEFFKENGLHLMKKDTGSHFPCDVIHNNMVITIIRGMDIIIGVDNRWEVRRVPAGITVEQLQTMLQNELGTALLLNGDAECPVREDDSISFSTWQGEFHMASETLPYETLEFRTSAVRDGVTHVRQQGAPGEQEVTTAVIKIGGVVTEKEIVEVLLLNEPVDEIIDIGTGGRLGTRTDTSAPDFHYNGKLVMNASAYTAGFGCTGKNPGDPGYGITASGRHVQPGIVSVDPSVIPLGTNLYVEGYGFALAADVGGAIKGNKIDLFHYELEDALRFGRRDLVVYILD
jgi:3D (Asp-Asp-Asp) domain-containing protein